MSDDKVRVCAMLSVLLCISIGISSDLPVDSSYPCLLLSDGELDDKPFDDDDDDVLLSAMAFGSQYICIIAIVDDVVDDGCTDS